MSVDGWENRMRCGIQSLTLRESVEESRRGRVIVCGSLVRVVNIVIALVQATHRLTFEKTSSWRVIICAYNEYRHTCSVLETSLGVAMARCGERMRTDRVTLAFIPSSEEPQPAKTESSIC